MVTKPAELDQRITANSDLLHKLATALEKAYNNLGTTKRDLEKAALHMAQGEEDMTRLYRVKAYMITENEAWEEQSVDPRTGEPTEDWGNMVIDRVINDDEEWGEAKKDYYLRQQVHADVRAIVHETQAKVDGLEAQLKARIAIAELLAKQVALYVPIVISNELTEGTL